MINKKTLAGKYESIRVELSFCIIVGAILLSITNFVNLYAINKTNRIIPDKHKEVFFEFKEERVKTYSEAGYSNPEHYANSDAMKKYTVVNINENYWFNIPYITISTVGLVLITSFIWIHPLLYLAGWIEGREDFVKSSRKLKLKALERDLNKKTELIDPNYDPLNLNNYK